MGRLVLFLFFCSATCFAQQQNDLIRIKGGRITIGTVEQPDAQPLFDVHVTHFRMQRYEVTNAQFSDFVIKTGYRTRAERNGGSYVFDPSLRNDSTTLIDAPWWRYTQGANWKHPEGIASDIAGKENHPVVHIAYEDACSYCEWLGMRLPTEVEWEYAAKKNGNEVLKNIWQGSFPEYSSAEDGFERTAPVGSFLAGKLGLFDMPGNVWEWCRDPYHQHAYTFAKKWKVDSSQPLVPNYFDEQSPHEETRVIRGGSFLCAENYCKGYEPAQRMRSSVKMTFSHIGFRCVKGK
ncbi:formylglycine-generating enzyme family protein [Fluviicola sp. SGL-29]|nr:formylglycine-generating enzyme family protein [Fluviicola sp. SGL-29]